MLWEKLAEMRDACEEDCLSTLPVYCLQDGKPVQNRTGVLLAISDSYFLVTAAHDLKKIAAAEIPFYVTSPKPGEGGVPLRGRIHGTDGTLVDVAIVEIENSTVEILCSAGARFLRVTDTDCHAKPTPGYYLLRGFPLECKGDPIRLSAVLYSGEWPRNSEYPFDPTIHLLLDHTEELLNRQRKPIASPRIVGMSGCGIWRLTSRSPGNLDIWTPGERKLVAIQTKCKHGSFLKGTWIRYVFALIRDRCPHLRLVMDNLILPP